MVPDAVFQPLRPAPAFPELPRLPALPQRLAAEPPGWMSEADVVVVGSGIAGLTAALECRPLGRIIVVTKDEVSAGSTHWAQGGIASVQAKGDTVEQHVTDTLVAGAGLCIEQAVRVLVSEGPDEVAKLIARGAEFDRDASGALALTREGGHLRHRIAHAGGDATGAEIERALVNAVTADDGIEIIEHALVLDLIPAEVGPGEPPGVAGVTLHVLGEGTRGGIGAVHARAVVLATGGIGQIYAVTTNPPVSTGDGVAAALRAGARLRDIEFIQFHPTVLYLGPGARGQLPLVSEAVRGEGGLLVNGRGERFMIGQHELAELAPRDVVAKAIMKEMAKEGSDHVWVDGRALGGETWRVRFPTILHSCRRAGINPATDLIPVAPACHYFCGGIETDLDGGDQPGRPLRVRGGGLVRGARREPARLQLAARGSGLRAPDRGPADHGPAAVPPPGRGPAYPWTDRRGGGHGDAAGDEPVRRRAPRRGRPRPLRGRTVRAGRARPAQNQGWKPGRPAI